MKSIRFEGKVHQFPDDATEQEIEQALSGKPAEISKDDRRAYTEALPGTPEGAKAREGIEARYGGRDAFLKQYDPTGEYLGKNVTPLLATAAITGGVPGLVPAGLEGVAAALGSPALRRVAWEAMKYMGKGAAAGVGLGGAYEAGRKVVGK